MRLVNSPGWARCLQLSRRAVVVVVMLAALQSLDQARGKEPPMKHPTRYRTNVDAYPRWQSWMRERQPRLLVIWGKYDLSFELSEPEAYRRDVPNAEVHVLDAGHFALDTKADDIAALVLEFMEAQK